MRVRIISGFRQKDHNFLNIESEYLKRIKSSFKIELKEIPCKAKINTTKIKLTHPEELLAQTASDSFKILLAEQGQRFSSIEFSELISNKMDSGDNVDFIIGGPYGVAKEFFSKFNLILSLSEMTMTSEFSRLVLVEQIYRSICIRQGKPYHKE